MFEEPSLGTGYEGFVSRQKNQWVSVQGIIILVTKPSNGSCSGCVLFLAVTARSITFTRLVQVSNHAPDPQTIESQNGHWSYYTDQSDMLH